MRLKSLWLGIAFVSIILVLCSTYLTFYSNYNRLEKSATQVLQSNLDARSEMLTSRISESSNDALFMQSVPPIQGIIRALENNGYDPVDKSSLESWKMRLAAIFKSYALAHDEVYQVRYIGLQEGGKELVRVDKTLVGVFTAPETALQQKSNRDYFRDITDEHLEGVYISEITLNREYGAIQLPHNPTIRFGIKVHRPDGTLFGFIIINQSIKRFLKNFSEGLPPDTQAFMLNNNEQFIVHPDNNIAFDFEFGEGSLWQPYFERHYSLDTMNLFSDTQRSNVLLASLTVPLVEGVNALTLKLVRTNEALLQQAIINTLYAFAIFVVGFGVFLLIFIMNRRNARHQSELLLEKSRNSSIIESSQDAVIGVSMDGKITAWNPSAALLFGYDKEYVLGRHTSEIILTEETQKEEEAIRKELMLGLTVKPFETVRKTRNGRLIDVSVSASPILDEQNNIIGVSKIIRDISEAKRISIQLAELNYSLEQQIESRTAQLRESHALQTAILENAAHLVIATDTEGVITLMNPAAEALLGYGAEELVGKATPQAFHLGAEVIERAKTFSKELMQNIEPGFEVFVIKSRLGLRNEHEWTYVTRQGDHVPVYLSVTALYDDHHKIIGYLGMATDISELTNHKKKLESLRDQLSKASEIANIGIWSWDTLTNEITWNTKMFQIYDMEEGSPIDFERWVAMVAEEEREEAVAHFREFTKRSDNSDIVFEIVTANGRRKTIHASATIEQNASNSSTMMIGINKDVSEQVRYEQELKKAKTISELANKTKSEFVANMSHEIRTPMNAIIGLLALIKRTELSHKQYDYIVKSESAAKSLLHIINDILDFSKVEAGKLEIDPRPFRLIDLVDNITTVLTANIGDKELELVVDLDPDIPSSICLDSLRLQQIIVNLASNAIKFTSKGMVSIKFLLGHESEDTLIIQVTDTGIGIAEHKQEMIFEAFSQAEASTVREFGGTGLGLVITKRLIELMDGSISIDSELGKGSCFTVGLPFTQSEHKNAEESITQELHFLIIDDRAEAREAMCHLIESIGWQATSVDGGDAAITLLQQATAQSSFDIVLVDWEMPSKSGLDTIIDLKKLPTSSFAGKIFVVTAYGKETPLSLLDSKGITVEGIINKPLSYSDFSSHMGLLMPFEATRAESFEDPVLSLNKVRILLAEDNPINQLVAKEILEAEGAYITVASNGLEAVQLAKEKAFDVILMDIQMPVMDGYTAAKMINGQVNNEANIPIIAMTANALSSDKQQAIDVGMKDHISKPFDTSELIKVIKKQLTSGLSVSSVGKSDFHRSQSDDASMNLALKDSHDGVLFEPQSALARLNHQSELYLKALNAYQSESVNQLHELFQVWDLPVQAGAIAHSLKGSSLAMGAKHLAELFRSLESAYKQGLVYPSNHQTLVQQAYDDTLSEILQYMQDHHEDMCSKKTDIEVDVRIALNELLFLLVNSNMKGIEAYDALAKSEDEAIKEILIELKDCIYRLDFQEASRKLSSYIETLKDQ